MRPRRNNFNLSHRRNFTCGMGELIPILCEQAIPGDTWSMSNEIVVRLQPMVVPIMHEIKCQTHYFFVPNRLLYPFTPLPSGAAAGETYWESYIRQENLSSLSVSLPRFIPSTPAQCGLYSLWDYFGFPVTNSIELPQTSGQVEGQDFFAPLDMPWRAYNLVYFQYYMDESVPLLQNENSLTSWTVRRRAWEKDYFTAARPQRQRGVPPALPVSITPNVLGHPTTPNPRGNGLFQYAHWHPGTPRTPAVVSTTSVPQSFDLPPAPTQNMQVAAVANENYNQNIARSGNTQAGIWLDDLVGALQFNSQTFNISDLRLAFQTQKFLERNSRAGTRYTSFLRSHYGVSPSDARLNRAEYIGGTHQQVVISEVLQTAPETSGNPDRPLGSMGGHGLAADGQFAGRYFVEEHGIIIALLSIMPKPGYQDGINRQWLYRSPIDFYFPELAHLSEQGIYRAEITSRYSYPGYRDPRRDMEIFGFTGQYDEHRVKHDMVMSDMRLLNGAPVPATTPYWNLVRKFNTENVFLNPDFFACTPRTDPFLVDNIRHCIVNVQHNIKATRPMPVIAEPGLVDHF
ncbi:major capsid protein [Tortoise microvirus 28]|nr:major capsid protein [Tortoise microvirus 28]